MRKGFTLLEIGIGLVVIGLCVGLVIISQSFLASSRIKSFVRDIQSYDMAVVNFYGKYKQLPGDSNIVEPHGNKNGKITDSVDGGVDVCGQEECEEPMFFWFQLSELAMINHPYNHDFANNMKPQTNVPNVTIGTYQDGLYVGYNAEDEGILGAIGNFYDIGGSKEIKMIDVIAIENKLDDGSPSTGIIRAVDNADEECTIDSVGGVCSNLYITIGGRTGIN